MDVDLTENGVAGVNEPMRCVRGNDHDTTGFHLARFVSHRDGGAAFKGKCYLHVGMRV